MLIGLHGYAQTGKDTVAKHLITKGFTRVGFADPIYDAIQKLNPIIYGDANLQPARIQDIVDREGWDSAKVRYPEIRRLLQVFGTEVGREIFGQDVWLKIAEEKILQHKNVVITDVRFQNELNLIDKYKGVRVKIHRNGVESVNGHVSDAGLPDDLFDYNIYNNQSIETLYAVVDEVLDDHKRRMAGSVS